MPDDAQPLPPHEDLTPPTPPASDAGMRSPRPAPDGATLTWRDDAVRHAGRATDAAAPRHEDAALSGLPTVHGYEILSELGRGGMGVFHSPGGLASFAPRPGTTTLHLAIDEARTE